MSNVIGDTIGAAFAGMPKRMMGVMDHMGATSKFMDAQALWERKSAYMSFVTGRSTKFQGPKRKTNRLHTARLAKLKRRNSK